LCACARPRRCSVYLASGHYPLCTLSLNLFYDSCVCHCPRFPLSLPIVVVLIYYYCQLPTATSSSYYYCMQSLLELLLQLLYYCKQSLLQIIYCCNYCYKYCCNYRFLQLHLLLNIQTLSMPSLFAGFENLSKPHFYWVWISQNLIFTEFENISKAHLLVSLRISKTFTFTEFEDPSENLQIYWIWGSLKISLLLICESLKS